MYSDNNTDAQGSTPDGEGNTTAHGSLHGMARRIEHRASTRWTADQVSAALVDPAYLRDRLAALGGGGATLLEHNSTNGDTRFRLRHAVPATDLPSAIRGFLKGDLMIERTETWQRAEDGSHVGTVEAGVPGVPGHIRGTMRLSDDTDGGSTILMEGQVVVNIPLLGGKVEDVIATQVTRLLGKEFEHTTNWLAAHDH